MDSLAMSAKGSSQVRLPVLRQCNFPPFGKLLMHCSSVISTTRHVVQRKVSYSTYFTMSEKILWDEYFESSIYNWLSNVALSLRSSVELLLAGIIPAVCTLSGQNTTISICKNHDRVSTSRR